MIMVMMMIMMSPNEIKTDGDATRGKNTGSITVEVAVFFQYTYYFQSYYDLGVDSIFNRNEYNGRSLKMTNPPPSVIRLYIKCVSHGVLQLYGTPQTVTGVTLLFDHPSGFNTDVCKDLRCLNTVLTSSFEA
jgi:hypothetical protein